MQRKGRLVLVAQLFITRFDLKGRGGEHTVCEKQFNVGVIQEKSRKHAGMLVFS